MTLPPMPPALPAPAGIKPDLELPPEPGAILPASRDIKPAQENPAAIFIAAARQQQGARLRVLMLARHLTGQPDADPETVPWGAVRFQHYAAAQASLERAGLAPATVKYYIAALRAIAKIAWQLGQMTTDDLAKITAMKLPVPGTLPAGRALSPDEITALFQAVADDPEPVGAARDACLLAILYATGMRVSEMCNLNYDDWLDMDASLIIQHGKGNKARYAFLNSRAVQYLEAWLAFRGSAPGPLLQAVDRQGAIGGGRLCRFDVNALFDRIGARAGVRSFSPHDLRRTCITLLLDGGADVLQVQRIAGHSSVQTTARYDRRPLAAQKRTAERLPMPVAVVQS